MRLPMLGEEVDLARFSEMVDAFMSAGFNYFDTAHGYINGKSEGAIRRCVCERYPREAFVLANKLSSPHFNSSEELLPLFESQLEASGVEYFDFYLMHAQDEEKFEKYKRLGAYEFALEQKRLGRVRYVGLSFHDKADVLDRILTEYPMMDAVQIQLNYVDYEDPAVEGRKVMEVCIKHGKPIIVMEPVKGGSLADLPPDAREVLTSLGGCSPAGYAIRFAAGCPGVFMVLSGMGNMEMTLDNINNMKDFSPLTPEEVSAIDRVKAILCEKNLIQCTSCGYCTEVCPMGVEIPIAFTSLNNQRTFGGFNPAHYYSVRTANGGKASDCVECGACEAVCPQHLPIRELLALAKKSFEEDNG